MKKNYKIFIVLLILALAGAAIYMSVKQSFLGVSEFKSDDGKGYWLISGIADSIGDKAELITKTPAQLGEGKLSDGTRIVPQKGLSISISKGNAQCEYALIQKTRFIWTSIFAKKLVIYYEVSSPERTINAIFSDDRGNSFTIDGTISQNIQFTDSDGKGKATITTLKSTQGKEDCPPANSLIVINAAENTFLDFSKSTMYLNKPQFTMFVDERSSWLSNFKVANVNAVYTETSFLNAFKNGILNIVNNKIIGTGRDIGDVIFTITADRDYFDSLIITPAKSSTPKINNVDYSNKIENSKSSSIKVNIINTGVAGNTNIQFSSDYFSVSPTGGNFLLDKEYNYFANIIAGSSLKTSAPITIKVCGVSQINNANCDTKTIYIDIVNSAPNTCGDGICQQYENSLSCSQDCDSPNPILPCDKLWQENGVQVDYKYNLFGLGLLKWGKTETPVCKTAGWVYGLEIAAVILVLGTILIYIYKPTKKKK